MLRKAKRFMLLVAVLFLTACGPHPDELADDIRRFAAGVEKLVQVEISDARFCALVSFAYNVGVGALARSTLLRLVNQGKMAEAPAQFLRWTKSGGKELAGLKRRREAEA